MELEQMSLARQVDLVFREIKEELAYLASGIVFIQIRNNVVGKFGIKHDPLEARGGQMVKAQRVLSEEHLELFRKMGIGSLEHKKHWTHGEISYEFTLRNNVLHASVQFESNYNMASVATRMKSRDD